MPSALEVTAATLLRVSTQANYTKLMEKLIQLEISRAHFSGVVLVSRDGKVLFEKAYGLTNAEWGIANTTSTKFEIGSITKPFTAILVMQLEHEGRLALNDSICKYLTPCQHVRARRREISTYRSNPL